MQNKVNFSLTTNPGNYIVRFARLGFLGSFECNEKFVIENIGSSNVDVKEKNLI